MNEYELASAPPVGIFRRAARAVLTHPWVLERAASASGGHATVFLGHRFTEGNDDSIGFPIARLRRHLAWLRSHRYRVVALGELVEDLRLGRPIQPRTIVFTVDDGYADFGQLAVPVFADFDCPVTVFVVTGFIEGGRWLWWDAIEFGISHSAQAGCSMQVGGELRSVTWGGPSGARTAAEQVVEWLKYQPAAARDAAIVQLLTELNVELPDRPTEGFAPMTWEQLRSLPSDLVSVGPHTVTHPILTMEAADVARGEIGDSWQRLREEVPGALPVFCYPNGDQRAFGPREEALVAALGLRASVSTRQGYVSAGRIQRLRGGQLPSLPRFSLESDPARFVQVASGVERFKNPLDW
jgi:peptidoglycan/xylan/chitin deacetylase (PgdA/CDA1 family)